MVAEILLVLVFAAAIVFAGARYLRPAQVGVESTTTIRVGPEATLWQIAQEHPVDDLSTAETVDILVDLNGMEDASLAVGQALVVPVPGDFSDTAVASR